MNTLNNICSHMRDATPEEHKSESDYFDRISTLVNSVVWKSADIHGNEEDHNLCLCRSAYNDFMFGNLAKKRRNPLVLAMGSVKSYCTQYL